MINLYLRTVEKRQSVRCALQTFLQISTSQLNASRINGRPGVAVLPRRRRGISIILVLALVSMTLALSYAMLRTQATIETTQRNSNHRGTARQAAMTGMSIALRTITESTWNGVDTGLTGSLGDGSTYAVSFVTGDSSLHVTDPDYSEYPYRITITSIGSVVDPANPQVQSTHKIKSVVQLVRRKLSDAPSGWSSLQPYTVYQVGTGSGKEVDIESPVHIDGPVYLQNKINYLVDYPNDGDDKPLDGTIDEVAIFEAAAPSSVLEQINDGTLSIQTLTATPAANPVAWWKFDDSSGSLQAIDQMGNHTGRYEGNSPGGSPSPTMGGTGAAEFDGYDDHIDIGTVDVSGSALTIMAWVKFDDFGHSDARIISKSTGIHDSDHYWMLSTINVSGAKRLRFRLKTSLGGTDVLYASSGNLTTDTWTFVAAVYDGITMRLYKDGQLVGWKDKFGFLSNNSNVRAAIGNNPPGSPRSRLLRDFEAMRVAGQGDFRPFSGPIYAPRSLTSSHELRLLESDSNLTVNDVTTESGNSPVTHPGDVTSYRLYPGGKAYYPTVLSSSLSRTKLGPDPLTNPLGLVKRQSALVMNDDVQIQGTVLVHDSGSSGRVEFRGERVSLKPISLPKLYGDSTVYQLPTLVANDDIEVYDSSDTTIEGLIMAWDDLQCFRGSQSSIFKLTGQVVCSELEIEARTQWDQSSSWWRSRYEEFLSQLDEASPVPHFPVWLEQNHGLDYEPTITLQPATSGVSYHWHDWSQPLFEAHPDDGGLRWDVITWQDGT